jgi:hypothetical protein
MKATIFFIFKEGKRLWFNDYQEIKKKLSEKNKEVINRESEFGDNRVLSFDFGGCYLAVNCSIDDIIDLTQNLAEELVKKEYTPTVISRDFQNGTEEEWNFVRGAIEFGLKFLNRKKEIILTNGCECDLINGVFTRSDRGNKCEKPESEHIFE